MNDNSENVQMAPVQAYVDTWQILRKAHVISLFHTESAK